MWMSTLAIIFFNSLAVFAFAFILWRKLKEDYSHEDVFKFTLAISVACGLGLWVGSAWLAGFVFWVVALAGMGAGYLYLRKLNLKFFEVIDALALGIFCALILVYLGHFISLFPEINNFVPSMSGINYYHLAHILLILSLIILYDYFMKNYRRFAWYPSGKIGFSGLASLALFFFMHGVINLFKHAQDPTELLYYSFLSLSVEVVNVIISLLIFFILGVILYQRSGRG